MFFSQKLKLVLKRQEENFNFNTLRKGAKLLNQHCTQGTFYKNSLYFEMYIYSYCYAVTIPIGQSFVQASGENFFTRLFLHQISVCVRRESKSTSDQEICNQAFTYVNII